MNPPYNTMSAYALLVGSITKIPAGSIGVACPVWLDEASGHLPADHFYVEGKGPIVVIDHDGFDSEICSPERVREDCSMEYRFAVRSEIEFGGVMPFWLLPGNISTSTQSLTVKVQESRLFFTAGFQMNCWSRFVWGTTFFGDSTTPQEHIRLAIGNRLQSGDRIPVRIGKAIGVLQFNNLLNDNAFEATFFQVGALALNPGTPVETFDRVECEGILASFQSTIGIVI